MRDDERKQAQQRAAIDQMRCDGRRRIISCDEVDPWSPEGEHDEPLVLLSLLPGRWRDRITVRAWG